MRAAWFSRNIERRSSRNQAPTAASGLEAGAFSKTGVGAAPWAAGSKRGAGKKRWMGVDRGSTLSEKKSFS